MGHQGCLAPKYDQMACASRSVGPLRAARRFSYYDLMHRYNTMILNPVIRRDTSVAPILAANIITRPINWRRWHAQSRQWAQHSTLDQRHQTAGVGYMRCGINTTRRITPGASNHFHHGRQGKQLQVFRKIFHHPSAGTDGKPTLLCLDIREIS